MARDFCSRGQGRRSTTGNFDLSAGGVELRGRSWVVNSELLNSKQIVTGGDAGGHLNVVRD
jgi:hypothetical protein